MRLDAVLCFPAAPYPICNADASCSLYSYTDQLFFTLLLLHPHLTLILTIADVISAILDMYYPSSEVYPSVGP